MAKVLLAEIDGLNLHLSLAGPGARPSNAVSWSCSSLDQLDSLLKDFMESAGRPRLIAGAFCAPGPVRNDSIQLTYTQMRIERARLRNALGASRIHLVNDFTARALAVPVLNPADIETVGGGQAVHDSPIGVIGPWRGLGVSILAPDSTGEWFPMAGEGGHITIAATNDREADVLSIMRHKHGRISAQEVTSEPGLVNLQHALAELAGAPPLETAHAVLAAAGANDPVSLEAVALFTGWIGDVAGNLALMVGARGGIYIFSPLMCANRDLFDRALLRARFEDKGPMKTYMAEVPLKLVSTPDAGLLGLSTLFSAADARMM